MQKNLLRKSLVKLFLFLVLTISILIIGCAAKHNGLPGEVSGLTIQKNITGKEAENYINKLHSQKVTSLNNEIGLYSGNEGKAIIYLTKFRDEISAADEGNKMIEKLSNVNSPFFDGHYMQLNGKKIYQCYGMGQVHFVFSNYDKLYWVSVSSLIGQRFLNDYLGLIKTN